MQRACGSESESLSWLKSVEWKDTTNVTFYHGAGCTHCHQSGYTGRLGVFELLVITDKLADAMRRNDTSAFQSIARTSPHYRSLLHSALDMAEKGLTTIDEVIRMAGEI